MEDAPKEGEPMKIKASALIVRGDTKEEVIEFLKRDIYTTSGIWDWEKVSPISSAITSIELRLKTKTDNRSSFIM